MTPIFCSDKKTGTGGYRNCQHKSTSASFLFGTIVNDNATSFETVRPLWEASWHFHKMKERLVSSSVWDEYRTWRRRFLVLFLGFTPGVLVIGVPLTGVFNSQVPLFVVAGTWIVLLAWAGAMMRSLSCPRCDQPFFHSWYHNPIAVHCLHCGLPIWTEVSVDDGTDGEPANASGRGS
jgi:hypothetical protein